MVGFWIFMMIMDLLVPIVMIGCGTYFRKRVPETINHVYGYRTSMSMKNKETWEFAHHYYGRISCIAGWIMIPVSVLPLLFVFGKNEDTVGTVGGIICTIQVVVLLLTIIPTEVALRKRFDKDGHRR